ncbi:nickel-responsive transcriptional regulator NikR [Ectobacillus polymachus]|uniref:nickel-responsive transcriptional regulator NikR n=1 Tax=Ectobacillus polymachus TaxID=1508806 RepID=UPI003A87707A
MKDSTLSRFGVSMDEKLLTEFDKLIANKGYSNRSEAVRDLVREALLLEDWKDPEQYVAGSILLFYDHNQKGLLEQMTAIQHSFHHEILATTHFHLDEHNCLELIIVKGKAGRMQLLSDQLVSMKGVKYGKFTVAPIRDMH